MTVTEEFASTWCWAIEATPRQREVLLLAYVAGLPDAEIALALGIAVSTVQVHRSAIKRKTRARLWVGELEADALAVWDALGGPVRPDPPTPLFRSDKREPAFPHPQPVTRAGFVAGYVADLLTRGKK